MMTVTISQPDLSLDRVHARASADVETFNKVLQLFCWAARGAGFAQETIAGVSYEGKPIEEMMSPLAGI